MLFPACRGRLASAVFLDEVVAGAAGDVCAWSAASSNSCCSTAAGVLGAVLVETEEVALPLRLCRKVPEATELVELPVDALCE